MQNESTEGSPGAIAADQASGARSFYGWKIVGISIVSQAFASGLTTYVFGLFQKPVAAEFGASFGQVGFGMTLMMVATSLFAPLLGVALDRHSIRAIMMIGAVSMSAGFALMSIASALWVLGLLFGVLVGLGMLALGNNGCTKLVANWFVKYRGRALGMSAVGTSVGGLLAPPVMVLAIDRYGWRGALICAALAVAPVAIPLVWLVVVNRPEDLGMVPDGNNGLPSPANRSAAGAAQETEQSFGVLLRELNFWVITLSVGVCFAAISSVIANLHPYATDLGVGSGPAALLLSCISICGIGGKLLFGTATDYFPARHGLWLAMAGLAVFLGVLLSHPGYGVLLLGAICGGLSLGGFLPVWCALIGRCYGRQAFGRVMGLMFSAMGPLLWVVFPFTGWVRDRTGNYDAAFMTFLFALALAAGLLSFLRLPEREPGI